MSHSRVNGGVGTKVGTRYIDLVSMIGVRSGSTSARRQEGHSKPHRLHHVIKSLLPSSGIITHVHMTKSITEAILDGE